MTNHIDHDKLIKYAHELDKKVRKWTERELRSTYSSEHLLNQAPTGDGECSAERRPSTPKSQTSS